MNILQSKKIPIEFKKFTLSHVIFLVSASMAVPFIGTLLMRVSQDPNIATKYNIIVFFFTGLSMAVASRMSSSISNNTIGIIGSLLNMSVYVFILIFIENLDNVYWMIAIVHAVASGFYWITYSRCILEYCEDKKRDMAIGYLGMFIGIIQIVLPIISGNVIAVFADYSGYYIMFGVFILANVVGILLQRRLKPIPASHKRSYLLPVLRSVYTNKVWFCVIHLDFFKGIREGTFNFFLNVMLFRIINNEAVVGINTVFVGIAALMSSFVASRILRPNNRIKMMTISTTALVAAALALFIDLNPVTIISLAVVNSFFGLFIISTAATVLFYTIDVMPKGRERTAEILSITECYKNLGRVLGATLILIIPQTDSWYVISLAVLAASQYITTALGWLTVKLADKEATKTMLDND